ncbi:RCC1 domain-containing protein [Cohnella faecalis]|uniref:Chromosome condensation regulator RCC1 n=1 Tax=Cohnella faecalis TaxID=2315694 RepID=A0A398CNY9_9BACL|nr:hypothetical protein [Cohnella faecalis]RIE02468.1 hypothetical protein D3H35_17365 [Cohnella faecalis]
MKLALKAQQLTLLQLKGELEAIMKSNVSLCLKMFIFFVTGSFILSFPAVHAQPYTAPAWGWKEIAVGSTHNLGIKNDGTVWQWGNTTTYSDKGAETNLAAFLPEKVPGLHNIKAVSGGQIHSIALGSDGTVWTWGGNHDGQLGDGSKISRAAPQQVSGLTDVVSIEADWGRSFAVKEDGTVWGWGGFYYRDSDGTVRNPDVPVRLKGFADIVSISTGYGNFMALKSDGTVWFGLGEVEQVSGLNDVVQIAVGAEFTYGLKKDGTVWYWGSDGMGMADGVSVADATPPRMLEGIKNVVSVQASAGGPFFSRMTVRYGQAVEIQAGS